MKIKKILSSALVVLMLVASIVTLIPTDAFASKATTGVTINMAAKDHEDNQGLSSADVKKIAQSYLEYNFSSAEEMLQYELSKNYLVYASYGEYTVYVNIHTGFMYYKNNKTGQIITSNPVDPAYQTLPGSTPVSVDQSVMSQIELTFSELSNSTGETTYNSLHWIMEGALLEVTPVEGKGIKVSYTLGDASEFFIAPGVLLSDDFKNELCKPIFDNFAKMLEEKCGEFDKRFAASNGITGLVSYNVIDHKEIMNGNEFSMSKITGVIDSLAEYFDAYAIENNFTKDDTKIIEEFVTAVKVIFTKDGYSLIDKTNADYISNEIKNQVSAIGEGKPVYKLNTSNSIDILRSIDKAIRLGNPEYTQEMAKSHEEACGYNPPEIPTPLFKCSINYFFDKDGVLLVDIPANTNDLNFDHSLFALTSFTPLRYLGASDMNKDGYIFYPDGSGTIVEFSQFYHSASTGKTNTSIKVEAPVYGNDYVYSSITGAHREQITMPVYGMVNDTNIGTADEGYTEVTGGFFAIIENGSSNATLCFESGGGIHKYASTYAVLRPYPSDKYDLSQSLSVSGLGFYYVVAETGFSGSYKYRVNMLSDEDNAQIKGFDTHPTYYPSDYAGMAACYRDYLIANGMLTPLKEFSEDLPLYIEALGSMDIVKRILTFPVTVSSPLTTFEDVEMMYDSLSDVKAAKKELANKAKEYDKLASDYEKEALGKLPAGSTLDEDDKRIVAEYKAKAERYRELEAKIENITNINFRLTGFANGGMYFTYPAKVKWERSVGGKRGFKDLLSTAESVSKKENYNFGIYPDFDFLFIHNTSWFDGISPKRAAARMVDNRYASQQSYDSIQQSYESLFSLVVSTDSLDKLYSKFYKKYSKYDIDTLSVSTLGSTLNSNFNKKNLVNRETALGHVTNLLDRMTSKKEGNYSLMTDVGNIYSVKYVDHILNASIDSSHFRYSSYTVPFYGMVLHGYVNYAGSALNYSGSPDYDILRSIESGASLYYILCCQNSNNLKSDELLSQYYGISFENWKEKILEQYDTLNDAIGDLQSYNIVDHKILVCERVIDDDELTANYERLVEEYVQAIAPSIEKCVADAIANADAGHNGGFALNINKDSIVSRIDEILASYKNREDAARIKDAAVARIERIIDRYVALYPASATAITVYVNKDNKDDIVYKSAYSYFTDSVATDKDNYVYTDFTCDNGSVVMVVYEHPTTKDRVVFILNYNTFAVEVVVDNTIEGGLANGETKKYELSQYGCYKFAANNDPIIIK